MKRSVTLELDEFGRESLAAQAGRQRESLSRLLREAALYYVSDLRADRRAARIPRFARREAPRIPVAELSLSLDLDDATWQALEEEAARQQVSVEALLEHAALYYLADLSSGRTPRRILNGPDDVQR
jgi:hypothetical protein